MADSDLRDPSRGLCGNRGNQDSGEHVKEKFGDPILNSGPENLPNGWWQYYVETHFAWIPTLIDTGQVFPSIVWLSRWWETYPECNGKLIYAHDVMPDQFPNPPNPGEKDMYRVRMLTDPRKKTP